MMVSDESDDEPLSVLAASKKLNPEKFRSYDKICEIVKKKKRKNTPKKLPATLNISRKLSNLVMPTIVKRPLDVWMYLKDLKPAGPYSCLLCPEWFINRSKMLLHYILNHKKDYCGICRYFVTERKVWWAHENFHSPWPCSQCIENFPSEAILRQHLSSIHNLIHCRLCHFQVPDNEEYDIHLFQKHTVTNVSSKNEEVPWDLDYEGSPKFHCLFCSKSNILNAFFNHYMGYHHFTLKCIANIICGKDLPFKISGADISAEFVEKMKGHTQFGYVDMEPKLNIVENKHENDCDKTVEPIVKGESVSDDETKENEETLDPDMKIQFELAKNYKGVEDFDVTLMELIVFQKFYFQYLEVTLSDIKSNTVPMVSVIEYEKQMSFDLGLECSLCQSKFQMKQEFVMHMSKMHNVRSVPDFSCRVCMGTFDNHSELDIHIGEEMGDFEDLWLCQFCDKEFDNREATRRHLTEHWDLLDYENCFSPHLGFKCKYCPTLFWNETDRETHQLRVHFNNHKNDFYKCDICSEIFGDKVWFIYHYLEKHRNNDVAETKYMFKCSLCCLVLNSVEDMRNHFSSNHPEARKIFCSLGSCCYKPLSHRKSFRLHLRTVHDPSRGRSRAQGAARCAVCGRQFESSRACSTHASQAHGAGKLNCNICHEHMNTMDERKLHYLIRHPGHHPFECRDCGKSFLYKSSLYMHRQEHVDDKKSYTCTICGKVFAKKDSYREHIQIHEGPRHACSYCPMRFVQRSNMLRHERRHTGERPYACPHCPRTFADKGACNSHVRTHIKGSAASYACVYCGQTFIQKSKLTYHIRKHTGENLERCTVCSKLFTSMCSLREHMKTHDPQKNKVKCPLCERKYKDERTMLRHLRTTHTSAQFSCPLCAKMLASPSGLRYHVITHSPLKTYRCNSCQKSSACKRTMIKHLRRRHNMKLAEINFKEHYDRLDPREAKLNLDEATLTSIFGPPKKKTGIIEDFVKMARIAAERGEDEASNGGENSKESDKESEEENQSQSQCESREEDELEPTDFVSVKIEPMEENDDY